MERMYSTVRARALYGAGLWTLGACLARELEAAELGWLRGFVDVRRALDEGWSPFYRRRREAAVAMRARAGCPPSLFSRACVESHGPCR